MGAPVPVPSGVTLVHRHAVRRHQCQWKLYTFQVNARRIGRIPAHLQLTTLQQLPAVTAARAVLIRSSEGVSAAPRVLYRARLQDAGGALGVSSLLISALDVSLPSLALLALRHVGAIHIAHAQQRPDPWSVWCLYLVSTYLAHASWDLCLLFHRIPSPCR